MTTEPPQPDWWGIYECRSCEQSTRASARPPYCPACGESAHIGVVIPSYSETDDAPNA